MDSDHRHELQENDLKHFLAHLGPWWRQHGNKLLAVVLVVVLAYVGGRGIKARSEAAHEQAWRDLAGATSPEGLRQVAETCQDSTVRLLGYLRGADLLLKEASDELAADVDMEVTAVASILDEAETMYRRVVKDEGGHPVYRLNARLGLACVAENRSEWQEARHQYGLIQDEAKQMYTAIGAMAHARLMALDRLVEPVRFAPEPEVKPAMESGAGTGSLLGGSPGSGPLDALDALGAPLQIGDGVTELKLDLGGTIDLEDGVPGDGTSEP